MRPLALILLLSALCSADVVNELFSYGNTVLNECTLCNLANVVRQQPKLVQNAASIVGKLPIIAESPMAQIFLSGAELMTKQPPVDCSEECSSKKDVVAACKAYLHLTEQLSEYLPKDDVKKECNSDKVCVVEQRADHMVITMLRESIPVLAYLVDPKDRCGLDAKAPKPEEFITLYSNKEFFNCQLCYSFLQFLNTAVVGGETETSRAILDAIGEASKTVCVALNLPAILRLIVPALGNLNCDDMPAVIKFALQMVLGPLLGEKAKSTCTESSIEIHLCRNNLICLKSQICAIPRRLIEIF